MAVTDYATDLDLHLNLLRRARFETVDTLPLPTQAQAGRVVRYAADGLLYACTGTAWAVATSAAYSFVHVQPIPQAVITVAHGLGYRPSVTMFSPDFGVQYAEFLTEHIDSNTVRVSMDTPHACALVMS